MMEIRRPVQLHRADRRLPSSGAPSISAANVTAGQLPRGSWPWPWITSSCTLHSFTEPTATPSFAYTSGPTRYRPGPQPRSNGTTPPGQLGRLQGSFSAEASESNRPWAAAAENPASRPSSSVEQRQCDGVRRIVELRYGRLRYVLDFFRDCCRAPNVIQPTGFPQSGITSTTATMSGPRPVRNRRIVVNDRDFRGTRAETRLALTPRRTRD